MNIDLIRRVAARIRGLEHVDRSSEEGKAEGVRAFDMAGIRYYCGTPACIAGHALAEAGREEWTGDLWATEEARKVMGLTVEQKYRLFSPVGKDADYRAGREQEGYIGPEHAARCLERLVERGEVDWEGARP